ncbi:hypothetical protein ACFV42_23290 [Streptomyces solisilvae]|uniref:hypothetical protein n=1 Tax=Streptomyces malaysiensis TaxID=92644 RepID=UPI0036CC491E
MKTITALATLSGLGAAALIGVASTAAQAADAPRNGDTASHSADAVASVLNGSTSGVGNLRLPAKVGVPAVASKSGPYQGANENGAPQMDGTLGSISNGSGT